MKNFLAAEMSVSMIEGPGKVLRPTFPYVPGKG